MELARVGGCRDREPGRGRPTALRHLTATSCAAQYPELVVATVSGFGTTGPYALVPVVRPGRAGRVVDDLPPGSVARGAGQGPRVVALCTIGHTAARRRAGRRHAGACDSGAGAHVDCAAYEALGDHSVAGVPLPRLGVRGARAPRSSRRVHGRHVAPDRRVPVRRRLRVDDVDAPAARRDARGARRRRPPRGVRPPRRVRAGARPRRRWTPRCTRGSSRTPGRSAPRAGAGRGAGRSPACTDAGRGPGGRPPAPARLLGRVRRPDGRARACCPARPYRHAEGGVAAPPARAGAPPTTGSGAAAGPRRARTGRAGDRRPIPRNRRSGGSGSSTSPRCGPVPTSPSCSPTSAPR